MTVQAKMATTYKFTIKQQIYDMEKGSFFGRFPRTTKTVLRISRSDIM